MNRRNSIRNFVFLLVSLSCVCFEVLRIQQILTMPGDNGNGNLAFHAFIPVFPLRLDEGTYSEAYIETLSMDFSDEFHQIVSSLEVKLIQQKRI